MGRWTRMAVCLLGAAVLTAGESLSVEWEDSRMDRCYGAQEACDFVKSVDFAPSAIALNGQFDR